MLHPQKFKFNWRCGTQGFIDSFFLIPHITIVQPILRISALDSLSSILFLSYPEIYL